MRKEKKDKHFLHQPMYPGGFAAIKTFIAQHLKYPEEAQKNKTEGAVYLRYEIDYQGIVGEVKIISSLGDGCDEEAIRVVKLLKFQVPKTRGLKVTFHKNIRIHFKLPEQSKQPAFQLNYSISRKAEDKPKSEEPGKSSGYTINY